MEQRVNLPTNGIVGYIFTYGKPNPPPRPTERPKNITDDGGIQVVESVTKL